MTQLTLWKIELSPPANAVRTLAEMLGLKLNLIDVDFPNLEHKSPEILKINPLGTVPILKDGDFILTDSHAQLKYLLAKYGKPEHSHLYPSDIEARAIVDQSLFTDAGIIFIRGKVVVVSIHDLSGEVAPHHNGRSERPLKDIEAAYAIIEACIGNKKYIAAEHLTIADLSLGASVTTLTTILKLNKKKFPLTSAWLDRLFGIPEFKKYVGNGTKVISEILQTAWAKNNAH